MKDIGKRIRTLREERGLTQEELAHKVGYKSRVSINKIELQRDLPIKKIVPIAEALGITPAELMGWEDNVNIEHYSKQIAFESNKLEKYVDRLASYSDDELKELETFMDFIESKRK